MLVTVIIGDIFALADRAKYYGITGIAFALASAIGPVLGGTFTDSIGWRWCCKSSKPHVYERYQRANDRPSLHQLAI